MSEETYGYDALEDIVVDTCKFGVKIAEARGEDSPGGKKIKFSEAVGLAVFAAPKALEHAGNAEEIKLQLKDLSQPERAALLAKAAEEIRIQDPLTEEVVDAWLDALASIDKAATKTVELVRQ